MVYHPDGQTGWETDSERERSCREQIPACEALQDSLIKSQQSDRQRERDRLFERVRKFKERQTKAQIVRQTDRDGENLLNNIETERQMESQSDWLRCPKLPPTQNIVPLVPYKIDLDKCKMKSLQWMITNQVLTTIMHLEDRSESRLVLHL